MAGLPLARLRWAIPEEVLSGALAPATGRKHMSANWLKDGRNQALASAAAYAMWGNQRRARTMVRMRKAPPCSAGGRGCPPYPARRIRPVLLSCLP